VVGRGEGSAPSGKVFLVGAGPGDPGLITKRGFDLLHSADAVCVDALVDPSLLAGLPPEVETWYVGKQAGHHTLPQREIEALLIRLAGEGKRVVRLKGGDPFVFGRGGEEALALAAAGIPFEVVPGVTAAVAACAYAGIPITHRALSTFAVLLTAHESPDKEDSDAQLPYDTLARLTGGTFAGYMGVRTLPAVVKRLLEGGMNPDTPAALIERGTMGAQRVVQAPLVSIAETAIAENVQPPALFVIGEVVTLADRIKWFHPGPLAGVRVMVTRPVHQLLTLTAPLQKLGATVIPAPSIQVSPRFVDASWKKLIARSGHSGWLVFTSENGVQFFFTGLKRAGKDLRWTGSFRIAAIGSGTRRALEEHGLIPDFVPSRATTAALAEELSPLLKQGEWVVRVRGNLGDTTVEKAIAQAGAEVQSVHVYETGPAPLDDLVQAWVDAQPPDVITFTSGSTFTSFLEQWGERADLLLRQAKVVSIGPFTSEIIRTARYEVTAEADPHDTEGLVAAIAGLS